jgi:predicted DNA-binding transcriptional regulator AlpA
VDVAHVAWHEQRNELMTTAEVAELVRAPASTVRYWRHLGSGPKGFRLGRRVVYARSDVEDWIRQQQAAQAK